MLQVTDELYHINCCIEYTLPLAGFELTTLVVIGTDCTGSCESNYHTIMTTTAPKNPPVRSYMYVLKFLLGIVIIVLHKTDWYQLNFISIYNFDNYLFSEFIKGLSQFSVNSEPEDKLKCKLTAEYPEKSISVQLLKFCKRCRIFHTCKIYSNFQNLWDEWPISVKLLKIDVFLGESIVVFFLCKSL